MEPTPKFDWVKARADCSLEEAFRFLVERLQFDVNSMNSRPNATTKFKCAKKEEDRWFVSKAWDLDGRTDFADGVAFKLLGDGIRASRVVPPTEEPLFLATPALTTAGECKLHIDGQPLELWEVSRKALDSLLFPFS
jgi:hypothetical protein